jgi:hypothetical protein
LLVAPIGIDRTTSFKDGSIMTMTIRIGEKTYHVTETDLRDLILRFEVRSDGRSARQYLVDGTEVTEEQYRTAFESYVVTVTGSPEAVQ